MENVVFDTSAILNCGKKGECEFLLERLAKEKILFTTPGTEKELRDSKNQFFDTPFFKKHFKIQQPENFKVECENLTRLAVLLSNGELSVILLALELNALAILDDAAVRKAAFALNIRVSCTLNILAEGIRRNWCNNHQCAEIVDRLKNNGFKMRQRDTNEPLIEYLEAVSR